MSKHDNMVGMFGAAIGLIGIGYALGTRSKMTKISEKLNLSIDELANKTSVDISNLFLSMVFSFPTLYSCTHLLP